jgi:hypothetical protein
MSGDRMSRTCQEAYRLSQELYRTYGHYQPSPFRAWTAEDMAWLVAADDASGHYVESPTGGRSPRQKRSPWPRISSPSSSASGLPALA